MLTTIIQAITGKVEPGQRKFALGFFIESFLAVVLFACVAGIWFSADATRMGILAEVAGGGFKAVYGTFIALALGNGIEWWAKR